MAKPELLIIAGPTASGKTAVAVELALRLDAEVVSADSMQVYRDMDILTAMPTPEEMRGVPHHMLGVFPPDQKCSAAAYRELALGRIQDILARGKRPIVCGGTGLYINALTRPLSFAAQGDDAIRAELTRIAEAEGGRERLHDQLKAVDPAAAARLHPNDVRRVVRALEIYRITGRTQSEQAALDAQRGDGPFSERVYALDWPREALYARIDRRVDEMLQSGLVDEVRRLMKNEAVFSTAAQAIGYKEIAAALRGECALAEAVETLKRATRNYAKRQLTWFRRDARVRWVAAQGLSAAEIAEKIITDIEVRP
ncbi:MAG TPA: tRNA (adenosine(37)-N6)-dimethylallyltransferase MiaA [Candidatus Pullichristensenella stercoripullorum]|nr:tRNA (adenosine(37)-N6)-dimethylallyltransferase MiaA [Candidatus Pullichristensenella stercoripullorum]